MNKETRRRDANDKANSAFFDGRRHDYERKIGELDTYASIRASVEEAIAGTGRLLDLGSGNHFAYDTALVREVVAVDVAASDDADIPSNVTLRRGNALDLADEEGGSYDAVLLAMLLHHVIGKTPRESLSNVARVLEESFRVLRPGGTLVLVESCVPSWFYRFERAVFPVARRVIPRIVTHPATMQYPASLLASLVTRHDPDPEVQVIPKGRWVLQYGYRFPAFITPVQPYRIRARKA